MSKPNTPKVDYSGMWRNYSTWSRDLSGRHSEALSFEEARMSRSGLKRDTPAWRENLSNLQKAQEAERQKLMGGTTANELREHMGKYLKTFGYGHKMKIGNSKPGGRFQVSDEARKAAEEDARQGRYFTHMRNSTGMTLAGRIEFDRLTNEADGRFGRPLQGWEAMARLVYGDVGEAELSPEEQSMQTAKQAAGGQRSSSAAAAAEELADEGGRASASPWMKK